MRKPVYKRMLIAILVGMMLTATSTIVSVKASPITVTVSPDSGPVGSIVTVSGNEATAGGEVRVHMAIFFFAFFAATTNANSTGGYSVNITVPALPAGAYSIAVLDVTTGDTANTLFTIQSKITLTSEEGSCYDEVTVKGYGFNSGDLITLTFDGDDVTPSPQPETNDLGSFEASFSVPSAPKGTHTVEASDSTNSASASFTVIPKIRLSPTSGPTATVVIVNGTGFASSAAFSVEFDTINVTMYGTISTNPDGSFMQIFLVPDVPDGTYTVNATDDDENSATAPFLVPSPVMTLEPSTTFGSSVVTAKGSGFPPNSPVLLYLEETLVVSLSDLMTESPKLFVDEYGSYEYSFIVPVTKPGVYKVTAYSISGDGLRIGEELASDSLTVVEDPTLTDINARLVSINGSIATIETDLGTIEVDLSDVNARLVSIDDGVATIETDLGTLKVDVSDIQAETDPAGYELAVASTILALIAAIGAWISAILIRRKTPPIA